MYVCIIVPGEMILIYTKVSFAEDEWFEEVIVN